MTHIAPEAPELQNRKQAEAYKLLIAAVIDRAIDDLCGDGPKGNRKDTDYAMAFILSETCEAWCMELETDYERIREKAVALYQRFIAKNDRITAKKKRAGKPAKLIKGVALRKSSRKPRIATGR